jgi:hypothetical protein
MNAIQEGDLWDVMLAKFSGCEFCLEGIAVIEYTGGGMRLCGLPCETMAMLAVRIDPVDR